ncbi:hypothetical protein [Thermococcus gorgonarius]|uniref:Uncharacterized protein n=1 Tax=Thermococcus gorgonarius TaxID=71997 RepID=A0A2Z2M5W6_THEGO|nr:hypothetical protein [Thermococcus gorgonarius]ASJ01640.1 hypothetical protein A3K92_09180 [Thermococcus gorgonarius]
MKETTVVGIIFTAGILISVIFKTYYGVVFAALGIPAYLAYVARHQNILAKSRLYDRDLFLMILIAIGVILLFNYLWDPRLGLITLAIVVPVLALIADRLKSGEKPQNS